MKRTLVLVLFYVFYSIEADHNLNIEINNNLKHFNNNARFADNFNVQVPKVPCKVHCAGNISRELMKLLDHLIVPGDQTQLENLKSNVKLLVEKTQEIHQGCPLTKPSDRKVTVVFEKYKMFLRCLIRTNAKNSQV